MIALRWSGESDAPALTSLHRDAWRLAYAGIIPGRSLEQMIGHRGLSWWRQNAGPGITLVCELDGEVVGYTIFGPARRAGRPRCGEIYELYMRPDCQGVGLGRQLFDAARSRIDRAYPELMTWSLAENLPACRFYRAMGGSELRRSALQIGGARLEKIAFGWRIGPAG